MGYIVFFSSTKAKGGISKFGWILASWIFLIAAFILIMGAYATILGLCLIGDIQVAINR